jgi:CDP-paratose 2-epimerase
MGKVDQGFMVLWMARHVYGGALAYTGFGGEGLQVRDILHIDDLYDLLSLQLRQIDRHSGAIYNVAGGADRSVSLRELTGLCQRLTGKFLQIGQVAETRPADVPYFVGDSSCVQASTGWRPQRGLDALLEDIHRWLVDQRVQLGPILGT